MKEYGILETHGLFGEFYGQTTLIKAGNRERAIDVYMKRYQNLHKQKSNNERRSYNETSERWGRIVVVDEKGFKRYYN